MSVLEARVRTHPVVVAPGELQLHRQTERQRIAVQFRSEGQGESARIHGERERELAQIQSEAYRQAEELRGAADAEATRIYAEAYSQDGEFYAFTKSLETYERTMDRSTFFILGTDSELLRFLENPR